MKVSEYYIAQTYAFIPNSRLSWVGKERDVESNLGDHGVRKYEPESGRFLSIDPLWEKYYAWTPYHYCGNDPVNKVDLDGKVEKNPDGTWKTIENLSGNGFSTKTAIVPAKVYTLCTDKCTSVTAFANTTSEKQYNTNCHGTALTNGSFWIPNISATQILNDDFKPLEEGPGKPGDVISFYNSKGESIHTETILGVNECSYIVNSKPGSEDNKVFETTLQQELKYWQRGGAVGVQVFTKY